MSTIKETIVIELIQVLDNIISYLKNLANKERNKIDDFWYNCYLPRVILKIKEFLKSNSDFIKTDDFKYNLEKIFKTDNFKYNLKTGDLKYNFDFKYNLEQILNLFKSNLLKNNFHYEYKTLEDILDYLNFYISEIKIKNLYCFKDFYLKGLRFINLITGENNIGKSSLLKTIAYIISGQRDYISLLNANNFIQDYLHDNYLHNDENKFIESEFIIYRQKDYFYNNYCFYQELNSFNRQDNNLQVFSNNLILLSHVNRDDIEYDLIKILQENNSLEEACILKAFQIISPDIEKITFCTNRHGLYLQKKDGKFISFSNSGGGIYKIAQCILSILRIRFDKNGYSLLLIDEIENSLYYNVQAEFWEMLIKLALHYRVQIIATSHSKEMIEALLQAAKKNKWYNHVAYFELYKDWETQEIKANDLPLEIVERRIRENECFRGES